MTVSRCFLQYPTCPSLWARVLGKHLGQNVARRYSAKVLSPILLHGVVSIANVSNMTQKDIATTGWSKRKDMRDMWPGNDRECRNESWKDDEQNCNGVQLHDAEITMQPLCRLWTETDKCDLGRGISVGHFNYIPLYGNVSTVLMYDLVGFTIFFSTTIAVLHTLSPPLFSKLQKLTAQLTRFIVILQLYMKFASIRNRTPSNVVLGEGDINTGFASCLFVHQTFVQTVKSQLSTYHWAFCNQTWYDCALPRAGFFQ